MTYQNTSMFENTRLHYLDAVRCFALILGVFFHAALSFMPIFIGWAVMDVSTGNAVPFFVLISHSFRMPLFFLIAGFFSHMTLMQKGSTEFIKSRLVRLGIPFVVGWFLLKPLLVSGWIIGAESMRLEADIADGLISGFASLTEWPNQFLVGTHLWFLYYLMLISFLALTIRQIVATHTRVQRYASLIANKLSRWLSQSNYLIVFLSLVTAFLLWFMQGWGLDTPDKSLYPNIPIFLIYFVCFSTGWLLHRTPRLISAFGTLSKLLVFNVIIGITASVFLAGYESQAGHQHYILLTAGFKFSYALMMWSLIALTLGLFERFYLKPSKVIQYIADASFWLYLTHLPIVVFLQIAVAELSIHYSIKLSVICILTIVIALFTYDLFVRSSFVGKVLNGQKKDRVLT